jgi:anti-sigma factor RsiW
MTMPPSERQPNRRDQHLTDTELNELVDGTLPASEAAAARAHLATCAECDERYRTLHATVSALRHSPSLMPRRSFQLTPEQAKLPQKAPSWLDRFAQRIVPGIPALRAATLAAALLLISVTAIDVITHRNGSSDQVPVTQMRLPVETAPPAGGVNQAAEPAQVESTEAPLLGETNDSISSASTTGGTEANETESGPPQGALGAAASSAAPAPDSVPTFGATEVLPAMLEPEATPSPSPLATASPVPAPETEESSGGASISRWRIAELALLLLLLWLIVSWVGRSRVEDRPTSLP